MRLSNLFMPTRKEDPADAEVVSHKLLVRGAYIRMLTRGIYDFLPLGWRSVRKIEAIIREEMDRAGAQEVRLPAVQPAELWVESDRKSTRLNSSHVRISYAVFCLKKKKKNNTNRYIFPQTTCVIIYISSDGVSI